MLSDELSLSNPKAWDAIVRCHYSQVFRAAIAQTRNHGLAEEVAQETFVRAFEKGHRFDGRGSLAGWLYRIAVNLSRDVMRRESVRRHADLAHVSHAASDGPLPPEVVHRQHCCQVVMDSLREVAAPTRRAFEMTVMLGYSYQQTAEIEGVPEGTIASRVSRVRNALARECRELDV